MQMVCFYLNIIARKFVRGLTVRDFTVRDVTVWDVTPNSSQVLIKPP